MRYSWFIGVVATLGCGAEPQAYVVPCDVQLAQCVKGADVCAQEHDLCVMRVEVACTSSQAACIAAADDGFGPEQRRAMGACYAAVAACVRLAVEGSAVVDAAGGQGDAP